MKEYDDASLGSPVGFPKPNHTLTFQKDGVAVGTLDFNGPIMEFTGQADESAKIFIEALQRMFNARLSEEYLRGRTDALADHGISGSKV